MARRPAPLLGAAAVCGLLGHLGRASPGCDPVLHEEMLLGGTELLSQCGRLAADAMDAASSGAAPPPGERPTQLAACEALSEPLVFQAFEGGPACKACAEVCVLALLFQALGLAMDTTPLCSQTLLLLVRAFAWLEDLEVEFIPGVGERLMFLVDARREQCAEVRRREIERVALPPAAFPGKVQPGPPPRPALLGSGGGAAASLLPTRPSEQVAILVAATPSMIRTYQPFLNLWRCYAWRHGLAFLLETDDTEVSPPHHRAPNWMRWFAARRQLPFYRALLVVDPDQFVVPECWNISIPAVLGAWAGGSSSDPLLRRAEPDVATRDFGRPQTLNNGVVLVRNSPRGAFFLELLLEKAAWMQTIEKDQGAFDESILELLGLEAVAQGEEGYNSECAQYVFPNVRGNHEVALYAHCWWRAADRLAGPFGARRSKVVRFADPRVVDVNHVVGARGLAEPAVLHHFAGRSKDWEAMLDTFGISRRSSADCRRVFEHVDAAAAKRACVPGAPAVAECEPPVLVC